MGCIPGTEDNLWNCERKGLVHFENCIVGLLLSFPTAHTGKMEDMSTTGAIDGIRIFEHQFTNWTRQIKYRFIRHFT